MLSSSKGVSSLTFSFLHLFFILFLLSFFYSDVSAQTPSTATLTESTDINTAGNLTLEKTESDASQTPSGASVSPVAPVSKPSNEELVVDTQTSLDSIASVTRSGVNSSPSVESPETNIIDRPIVKPAPPEAISPRTPRVLSLPAEVSKEPVSPPKNVPNTPASTILLASPIVPSTPVTAPAVPAIKASSPPIPSSALAPIRTRNPTRSRNTSSPPPSSLPPNVPVVGGGSLPVSVAPKIPNPLVNTVVPPTVPSSPSAPATPATTALTSPVGDSKDGNTQSDAKDNNTFKLADNIGADAPADEGSSKKFTIIAAATASSVLLFSGLTGIVFFYRRKKNKAKATSIFPTASMFTDTMSTMEQEIYTVYIPYVPELEDELELAVGDQVMIQERFQDKWVLGTNLTTGETGCFPVLCLDADAASSIASEYERTSSLMMTNKFDGVRNSINTLLSSD